TYHTLLWEKTTSPATTYSASNAFSATVNVTKHSELEFDLIWCKAGRLYDCPASIPSTTFEVKMNVEAAKSLTRNSLLRSAPGEPSSEQLDGGDVEPARGAFDGCFEVLGKAAVAVEPSDGSLDHPPARQELEPLGGI